MKKYLTKILCLIPAACISTLAISSVSSCKEDHEKIDALVIDGFSLLHMYDVQPFYAIMKPQNKPTNDVEWAVSDESIGSINKETGEFTALAIGSVSVTATWKYDNSIVAQKEVEIVEPSPSTIIIDGPDTVRVGRNSTYAAKVEPKQAEQTVNWLVSEDDEDVATIDQNGVLHPKKTGDITIYAQSTYDTSIIGNKTITIDEPLGQDFRTDSWDTILYFIENGGYNALYNAYKNTRSFVDNNNSFVGFVRKLPITMNNKTVDHDVVVIGVQHDDIYKSNEGEKAALTFEFKNLLWDGQDTGDECNPMYIRWNPPLDYGKDLNYWYLNENIYSEIRLQLSTKVRDLIDAGLGRTRENSPIKIVAKTTNRGGDDFIKGKEQITSPESVFILSLSEVYSGLGIGKMVRLSFMGDLYDIFELWEECYSQEGQRYEYWQKRIGDNPPCEYYDADQGTNAYPPGAKRKVENEQYGFWFRSPRIRTRDSTEYETEFYTHCFAYFDMYKESPSSNFWYIKLVNKVYHNPPQDIAVLPCFCI